MRHRPMLLALSILLVLAIAAAALSANAIRLNRVPVLAPPGAAVRLGAYFTQNVAETRFDHPFPELRTRVYSASPVDLIDHVRQACASLGWAHIGVDEDRGMVRAQVRTPLLGFTDHVEVRVSPVEAGGATRVEVTSSSRVGRGDLGANARHVMDLYAAVDRALAEDAGGG